MDRRVFVKGDISFSIRNQALLFRRKNISVFGLTGLPWGVLSPTEHFGLPIDVSVQIPTRGDGKTPGKPLVIKCRAVIVREQTVKASYMGIRFDLSPQDKLSLAALIAKEGSIPIEYSRKYPRIPSLESVQTYPLHVIALLKGPTGTSPPMTLVMDVQNISLEGIMLSTENQSAVGIRPGERLDLILEPRGWFPVPVRVQSQVCRITDDVETKSGNMVRQLGIRFLKFDDVNQAAFKDLLRDIVLKIKSDIKKP